MTSAGILIFLACVIGIAILGAIIAVIASVSGASAAIEDDEELVEKNSD